MVTKGLFVHGCVVVQWNLFVRCSFAVRTCPCELREIKVYVYIYIYHKSPDKAEPDTRLLQQTTWA